jgi:hypothetical protein
MKETLLLKILWRKNVVSCDEPLNHTEQQEIRQAAQTVIGHRTIERPASQLPNF